MYFIYHNLGTASDRGLLQSKKIRLIVKIKKCKFATSKNSYEQ
jgi:hypothetical protein